MLARVPLIARTLIVLTLAGCAASSAPPPPTAPAAPVVSLSAENDLQTADGVRFLLSAAPPSLDQDSLTLLVSHQASERLEINSGRSLILVVDGDTIRLRRVGLTADAVGAPERATYIASPDLTDRLATATRVDVRLYGRSRHTQAAFGNRNFQWFRTYTATYPLASRGSIGGSSGGCVGSCPVQVRGYYRKDGTYVRPHTRSRPGSRRRN